MTKTKETKKKTFITTPIGKISFPYLTKPDVGRQYSDNKFKTDLLIPKDVWATEGKEIAQTVLKFAREFFNKPKLTLKDFKGPFTDMDLKANCPDFAKGHIMIRAKSDFAPKVLGPTKVGDKFPEWSTDEVAKIKGGDYGRLLCAVFGYSQNGGGISLGLNYVQFAKPGTALGQGNLEALKDLGEIEVTPDDPSEMIDTEQDSTLAQAAELAFG